MERMTALARKTDPTKLMAFKPSNNTIELTADYVVATSLVQFTSSAKMKITYKNGSTFEGTFDEWKKDDDQRRQLFYLKTVVVGRKAKKVQAFMTPATDSERSWLTDKVDGLKNRFPLGCSQQVGRDSVTAFQRLFKGVFPDSKSYTLGLVDRGEDKPKAKVTTNVPA
jgi:hypothetical protein